MKLAESRVRRKPRPTLLTCVLRSAIAVKKLGESLPQQPPGQAQKSDAEQKKTARFGHASRFCNHLSLGGHIKKIRSRGETTDYKRKGSLLLHVAINAERVEKQGFVDREEIAICGGQSNFYFGRRVKSEIICYLQTVRYIDFDVPIGRCYGPSSFGQCVGSFVAVAGCDSRKRK